MRIDELPIHPIAQAVLRYFCVPSAAKASGLSIGAVLELLNRSLTRLPPEELKRAGENVLDVCRFLTERGDASIAESIARCVSSAVKMTLVQRGAVAALAPDIPPAEIPAPPPKAQPIKRLRLLESQWDSMSEERKAKLARLADELTSCFERSAPRTPST